MPITHLSCWVEPTNGSEWRSNMQKGQVRCVSPGANQRAQGEAHGGVGESRACMLQIRKLRGGLPPSFRSAASLAASSLDYGGMGVEISIANAGPVPCLASTMVARYLRSRQVRLSNDAQLGSVVRFSCLHNVPGRCLLFRSAAGGRRMSLYLPDRSCSPP